MSLTNLLKTCELVVIYKVVRTYDLIKAYELVVIYKVVRTYDLAIFYEEFKKIIRILI